MPIDPTRLCKCHGKPMYLRLSTGGCKCVVKHYAAVARYRKTEKGRTARRTAKARYARTANRRFRERVDLLKRRPCSDCQRVFPPCAMDFDHVRGVKHFTISEYKQAKWETLAAEIAKCDLVCANCHRIRTHVTKCSKHKHGNPRIMVQNGI